MTCIFCDIIAGRAPASRIAEDELCFAFMDIRPVNPGHALVIPKFHSEDIAGVPEDAVGRMFQMGRRIGAALRRSGLRCEGVNYLLADGRAAGQEVFHAHLHVLPRFGGDGFGFRRPPGSGEPTGREQLARQAAAISALLEAAHG